MDEAVPSKTSQQDSPEPVPRAVLLRIRKLADLASEVEHGKFSLSVTRLTVLKSLCKDAEMAGRFVIDLAHRTCNHIAQGKRRSSHRTGTIDRKHRELMAETMAAMDAWQQGPTEKQRRDLQDLRSRLKAEQNEFKKIKWGSVRIITDSDLLLFELAVSCLLCPAQEAGRMAYQTASHFAERYNPRYGTGLPPESAPLVREIADFWMGQFGLTAVSIRNPQKPIKKSSKPMTAKFTHRQGQFLAFIHAYRTMHRQSPAELDMVKHFRLTPPSVHSMIVRLEELGFVTREPGVPRSVQVAIPASEIPALEPVAAPPW